MLDFKFLTKEQVRGINKKLDIIKKYGARAKLTDFAVISGSSYNYSPKTSSNMGYYWLMPEQDLEVNKKSPIVTPFKPILGFAHKINNCDISTRLVIPYYDVLDYTLGSKILKLVNPEKDVVDVCEFGYYPQRAVNAELQQLLESSYKKSLLSETGNVYTRYKINSTYYYCRFTNIRPEYEQLKEYMYEDERYVRVKVNLHYNYENVTLSNDVEYVNDEYVWIKVEPIRWLIDINEDLLISEDLLFTTEFASFNNKYSRFENMDIKKFIDNYFAKELIQVCHRNVLNEDIKKIMNNNYYPQVTGSTYDENASCDEEIIDSYIPTNKIDENLELIINSQDKIIELLTTLNAVEESIDDDYNTKKEYIKEIRNSLFDKLCQKETIESDEIKDVKQKIRKL